MSSLPQIILASQSPARAELLAQIHIPFTAIPSEISENGHEYELTSDPKKYLLQISKKKANSVASRFQYKRKNCIIIGCDTVIMSPSHKVIGKPMNRSDAEAMLQNSSGKFHQVLTGCTILIYPSKTKYQTVVSTLVKFRILSKEEIDYYLERGEWRNKAGAYAIQGLGAFLISEIQGDYFNIVGLPVSWIWQTLWDHYGRKLLLLKKEKREV